MRKRLEIMKKKTIVLLITSSLMASVLTGCGDLHVREEFVLAENRVETTVAPAETAQPTDEPEVTEEPIVAELSPVQELELRYSSGDFKAKDLYSLGSLYLEQGQIKKGRDMLETALLLYGEEETKTLLAGVTVNVAEESVAVQEKMNQLATNFELEELENEVVGMILADDWYETMLPGVALENRSYYLQKGDALYYVQVGKNENGKNYTTITRTIGEAVTVLRMEGNTLQRVDSQLKNGNLDGAFESWMVDKNTSDIVHETGTFAEGKYVGDYSVGIRWGSDPSDFFTLWISKENKNMMSYAGSFDENGKTTVDQKNAGKVRRTAGVGSDNPIIYAQTSDGSRCLFVDGGEGQTADQLVFDVTVFDVPQVPSFETYEPVVEEDSTAGILQQGQTLSSDQLKVRVFDGQIQIFDGTSWYNMGSVDSYVAQDPMTSLKNQAIQDAIARAEAQQQEEEQQSDISIRSAGSVAVATPKPTQRPVTVTQAPATPAPTQAPVVQQPSNPEPQQPSNPQPQEPAPTQAPATPAPTPQPTPEPTPAPTEPPAATEPPSNDTDAEFTPDMM